MRRSRLSRQATQAHGEGGASAGAILAVLGCVVAGVAFFALRVETRQPGAGREADPRPPGTQAPRVEPRVDPPADQPPARPARPREVPAPPKPKAVDLDAPVSSVPGNAYAPDEAAVTEEAKRRFRANADRIGYSSTDSDEEMQKGLELFKGVVREERAVLFRLVELGKREGATIGQVARAITRAKSAMASGADVDDTMLAIFLAREQEDDATRKRVDGLK